MRSWSRRGALRRGDDPRGDLHGRREERHVEDVLCESRDLEAKRRMLSGGEARDLVAMGQKLAIVAPNAFGRSAYLLEESGEAQSSY